MERMKRMERIRKFPIAAGAGESRALYGEDTDGKRMERMGKARVWSVLSVAIRLAEWARQTQNLSPSLLIRPIRPDPSNPFNSLLLKFKPWPKR